MQILSDIAGWDGRLPAVFVAACPSVEERRRRLRHLAARALGVPADGVAIRHREGFAPALARPAGGPLHLSSASRDGLAALALGLGPIGVDVERADPGGAIPWRVLHPAEAEGLRRLSTRDRARAFAQLWACKEAYLKAVGLGLAHDPASFEATIGPDGAAIRDPAGALSCLVATAWHSHANADFAVAAVGLAAGTPSGRAR